MMKKEMLLTIFVVGCVVNSALGMENDVMPQEIGEQIPAEQKHIKQPKIFDKGSDVQIDGNELFSWLFLDGYQTNPSPEFDKTTVVKLKKNGLYDTQFQLKDIKKAYSKGPLGRTTEDNKKISQYDKFHYYGKANNAVECPGLIQLPNRDGELKDVMVAIYATQNVNHCESYKKFLEQQKQEKAMESMLNQPDQY